MVGAWIIWSYFTFLFHGKRLIIIKLIHVNRLMFFSFRSRFYFVLFLLFCNDYQSEAFIFFSVMSEAWMILILLFYTFPLLRYVITFSQKSQRFIWYTVSSYLSFLFLVCCFSSPCHMRFTESKLVLGKLVCLPCSLVFLWLLSSHALAILFSQAERIDYKHWTEPNWITAIWFNLICGNYLTNSFSYLMVIPRMFAYRLFKGSIKIWTEYLCTELSPVVLARGWIGHLCELFRLLGFMTLLSRSLAHTHTCTSRRNDECVWLRVCWYYWDQISLQEKFCVELPWGK